MGDVGKRKSGSRQSLYRDVWATVLEMDDSFVPYFNAHEKSVDGGIPFTVAHQTVSGQPIFFCRQISRKAVTEVQTTPTLPLVDSNGNKCRGTVTTLLESLSPADAEDHETAMPYARVAARLIGTGHVKDQITKYDPIVMDRLLLPLQLYHELLHVRFRLEQDELWPPSQRPYTEFFNQWANPNSSEFTEKKQKITATFGQRRVQHWLEEKFAVDQVFGKAGSYVFNEEVATAYGKRDPGNTINRLCELYDSLDRAHRVPTSGRPSRVSVAQFMQARGFDTEKQVRFYIKAPDLTDQDLSSLWRITHGDPNWPTGVQMPLPRPLVIKQSNFAVPPETTKVPPVVPSPQPEPRPDPVPFAPEVEGAPRPNRSRSWLDSTSRTSNEDRTTLLGWPTRPPLSNGSSTWHPSTPDIPPPTPYNFSDFRQIVAPLPGTRSLSSAATTQTSFGAELGGWNSGVDEAYDSGILRPAPPEYFPHPPLIDGTTLSRSGDGFDGLIARGGFGSTSVPDDVSANIPVYRPPPTPPVEAPPMPTIEEPQFRPLPEENPIMSTFTPSPPPEPPMDVFTAPLPPPAPITDGFKYPEE
jgi:hypothetical protein